MNGQMMMIVRSAHRGDFVKNVTNANNNLEEKKFIAKHFNYTVSNQCTEHIIFKSPIKVLLLIHVLGKHIQKKIFYYSVPTLII